MMTTTYGGSMPVVRTEHWVTEPIKIQSVRLERENVAAIARYLGANGYEVMTSVETGAQRVVFYELADPSNLARRSPILQADVGDYIMLEEAHTDIYGDNIPARHYRVSSNDIHKFTPAEQLPAKIAGVHLKSAVFDSDNEVTSVILQTFKGTRHANVLRGE